MCCPSDGAVGLTKFTHEGRPLPRTQWEQVCGDTCTVGDLWNTAESRYNTASELGIYDDRLQKLIASVPRAWNALLVGGKQPLVAGDWALQRLGTIGDADGHDELGTPVQVKSVLCTGWVVVDVLTLTH